MISNNTNIVYICMYIIDEYIYKLPNSTKLKMLIYNL